jgi:hypothetical protein
MLILMVHFSGVFSKMNTTILFFTFFKCLCLLRVWKNISKHVFLLISGRKKARNNFVVFCSLCSKKMKPHLQNPSQKNAFWYFLSRMSTLASQNNAAKKIIEQNVHISFAKTLFLSKKRSKNRVFELLGFFWAVWEFCEGYLGFIFWKQANLSDLSDFRKSCFWWFCSFRDPHLWANCLVDSKTGFRSRK